ncbi:MAG: thiamine phosphate synthase [Blastocatellia bacterium]|nr:thiamine phosphate synthase [Blastocatellia bacterium]
MSKLPPQRPLAYLITDRRAFRRRSEQIEALARAAEAGCPLIQIREKDLSTEELCRFAREVIRVARPHGARILINDDIEAALASGADGVHLRAASLPVAEALTALGLAGRRDLLIAASTHSQQEAAAAAGADFIVCGPVYDTPSKRAYGPPLGLERFGEICRAASMPVLALGGITMENYAAPLREGAAGIAAIGLFADPATIAANLQRILQSTRSGIMP